MLNRSASLRMSTSVLEALPGKLDIKRHSPIASILYILTLSDLVGAQWLSGRVLDFRPRGCGFEPERGHCVVSLSKTH